MSGCLFFSTQDPCQGKQTTFYSPWAGGILFQDHRLNGKVAFPSVLAIYHNHSQGFNFLGPQPMYVSLFLQLPLDLVARQHPLFFKEFSCAFKIMLYQTCHFKIFILRIFSNYLFCYHDITLSVHMFSSFGRIYHISHFRRNFF